MTALTRTAVAPSQRQPTDQPQLVARAVLLGAAESSAPAPYTPSALLLAPPTDVWRSQSMTAVWMGQLVRRIIHIYDYPKRDITILFKSIVFVFELFKPLLQTCRCRTHPHRIPRPEPPKP